MTKICENQLKYKIPSCKSVREFTSDKSQVDLVSKIVVSKIVKANRLEQKLLWECVQGESKSFKLSLYKDKVSHVGYHL